MYNEKHVPKDSISVLPSTPVVTVNADPVNVLEPSDDNNLHHREDLASDEKVLYC